MAGRLFGFGRLKHKKGARRWARFFNDWLEDSVTYRNIPELNKEFSQRFDKKIHIEDEYLSFRFAGGKMNAVSWFARVSPFNYILS